MAPVLHINLWPMRHQVVDARGTRIHCVEEGSGPLVLLVHGFPEWWYSWRHQLPAIAEAGFRAVAIDVRGYGRSSAPLEVEADQGSPAVLIGHHWGAPIAAHSALLRPDIFTAVARLRFYVAASADGGNPASGGGSIATVARDKMLRDRFPASGPLPG